MDKDKKFKIEVWILGSLLGGPLFIAFAWRTVKWAFSGEDPSIIIWRICIAGGVLFLICFLLNFAIVTARRWDKTGKRDLDTKIKSELGLKPISEKDLLARYIDRRRFYAPVEPKPLKSLHRHIYHGEYNGYEICIFEPYSIPMRNLAGKGWALPSLAVHFKASSFHFPKFLITNSWGPKFFVKGDQKAQMLFAKSHILDFFSQTLQFAAQGNGNEFIFYQIEMLPGNYSVLLKNAFNVLKLLTNAATPSHLSEIGLMQKKYKRSYIWALLKTGSIVLLAVMIIILKIFPFWRF
jgi:hypothetical protein